MNESARRGLAAGTPNRKGDTLRKRLGIHLYGECLLLTALVSGAARAERPESLVSPDGRERAIVSDVTSVAGAARNLFVYDSPQGHLEVEVGPGRISVGDFSVAITRRDRSQPQAYLLTVASGRNVATTDLTFDPGASDTPGQINAHVSQTEAVSRLLQAFAASQDGRLLAAAKDFITRQFGVSDIMLRDMSLARAAGSTGQGRSPLGFWSWGCAQAVLNQVAAGAAMVGGCGTPACGPAYEWCCASGVAWYSSAFIGTWTSCS